MPLCPQLLEPRRIGGGVANGFLNVAVPKIVMNQTGVRALVSESKSAGMAQNVGINGYGLLCLLATFGKAEVDSRGVQGLALLT